MTRVLKFSCRSPVRDLQSATLKQPADSAMLVEMSRAHQYYNVLVSIERWRRAEYRAVRTEHVPTLPELLEASERLKEFVDDNRDKIRDKRKRASVVARDPKKIVPTKRVDALTEQWCIEEAQRWLAAARKLAKPLREQFSALVDPAEQEYRLRCSQAPQGDNHARSRLNQSAYEAMLAEPEWHDAWKRTKRADRTAHALTLWMRDYSGLSQGTYVATEDAVKQASKPPRPRPDGQPRRYRERPAYQSRHRGGGLRRIGQQLGSHGTTLAEVLAGRGRGIEIVNVRSAREPASAGRSGRRNPQNHSPEELAKRQREGAGSGNRSRMRYATVRLRIGKGQSATWAEADVFLHRPIPEDTRIKFAFLVPHVERGKLSLSLSLTVDAARLVERAPGEGVARVTFGWTKLDDGSIEVGRLDGKQWVVLPAAVSEGLDEATRLRGASDRQFDEARTELSAWMRLHATPPELLAATEHLGQWRAHGRLREVARAFVAASGVDPRPHWKAWKAERLAIRLSDGRAAGDLMTSFELLRDWLVAPRPPWRGIDEPLTQIALWLDWWRRKDLHLEELEANARSRAINRRRDVYRCAAARLSEQIDVVELQEADFSALALRDQPEAKVKELHRAARRQRVKAAPSELRQCIREAFGPDRVREGSGGEGSSDTARGAKMQQQTPPGAAAAE